MPSSRSDSRIFPVRVSVWRTPAVDETTGIRTEAVVVGENLMISPIDPIGEDSMVRYKIETAIDTFEAYLPSGSDIQKGDDIVVFSDGKKYDVIHVGEWEGAVIQLILERVRAYA